MYYVNCIGSSYNTDKKRLLFDPLTFFQPMQQLVKTLTSLCNVAFKFNLPLIAIESTIMVRNYIIVCYQYNKEHKQISYLST